MHVLILYGTNVQFNNNDVTYPAAHSQVARSTLACPISHLCSINQTWYVPDFMEGCITDLT